MNESIVYLMRGLPACGKSFAARKLAGETGIICETDEYFYTQVGGDPTRYDFHSELLSEARSWNFERFVQAVAAGTSTIVIDRGNGLNAETRQYATYAEEHGYKVELKEPDSQWWGELHVLLKYKQHVANELLDAWAERLAEKSRTSHRVPASTIRHWMSHWRPEHRLANAQRIRF